MQINSLEDAEKAFLRYVPKLATGSQKSTLETIGRLLEYVGNPQDKLRVIHVAGTSGKTSTSYFIRALLQQAGQKTGLTVSPHITSIKERVQIDDGVLSDEAYLDYANEFLALIEQSNVQPSFFEAMMAFAYWVFWKEKVDYAVVETGMGGLLDGSNMARRADKVAVITDIGIDHTRFLGETVSEIALQKAGIIHPDNATFVIGQSKEALGVVREYAIKQGTRIQVVSPVIEKRLPAYQQRNWSVARAAFEYVRERDQLPTLGHGQIEEAIRQLPPGRLEKFQRAGKTIILDGAHNQQKLSALAEALSDMGVQKTTVLANFVESSPDKMSSNMQALLGFTKQLIIPEFMVVQDLNKQSSLAETTAGAAQAAGIAQIMVEKDIRGALERLLASPGETVVVTGSLYLVSKIRALLEKYQ